MTPANIDLATSEALKIAREVDPDGETQIRVIFSTCTALSKWCTLKLRGSHNFLSDIKMIVWCDTCFCRFHSVRSAVYIPCRLFSVNFVFFSSLNFPPKFTSLSGKLRTEFSCLITKNPLALHYQRQLYLQCWSDKSHFFLRRKQNIGSLYQVRLNGSWDWCSGHLVWQRWGLNFHFLSVIDFVTLVLQCVLFLAGKAGDLCLSSLLS